MKRLVFFLAVTVLFFSCRKDDRMAGTFDSDPIDFEAGKARSFINLNSEGEPMQLGVTINEAALMSNPTAGDRRPHPFLLNDEVKKTTPFRFVDVCWNPMGHAPAGVYDKPHFDFHFYMMPEEEVMAIADDSMLMAFPSPDYVPANYFAADGDAMMGMHWVDGNAPEIHGQPFTQTFVYGSYNGNVTFYEPMLTLDFLKSTQGFERTIPQPAKFKKDGWYPTKMRIAKHDGLTDVVLEGFVKRAGS